MTQPLSATSVDPRTFASDDQPSGFVVIFWRKQNDHPDSGYAASEYELASTDIIPVLDWARDNEPIGTAHTQIKAIFRGLNLLTLAGHDPTRVEPSALE